MRTIVLAPMSREARAIGPGAAVCPHASDIPQRAFDAAAVVLIAGVCGGLDPSLAPGAIVLARKIIDAATGAALEPRPALFAQARAALRASGLPFVSSALLTTAHPINDHASKTDAWNEHGAAAADVETYELAQALDARGVPWLALRAVLDPASSILPRGPAGWTDEQDDRRIARELLRHPLEWPAYARLALQLRTALRSLSRAVPTVTRALDVLDVIPDAIARPLAGAAPATAPPPPADDRQFINIV